MHVIGHVKYNTLFYFLGRKTYEGHISLGHISGNTLIETSSYKGLGEILAKISL
jgi:hypothetical protein